MHAGNLSNICLGIRRYEKILSVLKSVDGNKTQAAKVIGIDRVSLWRKLKKYEQNGIAVS